MDNLTTLESASVNYSSNLTLNYEQNVTYRIFSNTTEGRANYSEEVNLSVLWDCTWNYAEDLDSEIGGWDENKELGNLTLMNTGDAEHSSGCVLNFGLTYSTNVFNSDGLDWVRFGSEIWPKDISVSPETNSSRTINASFNEVQSPTQDNVEFKITDESGYSSTNNRTFNSTLINSKSGPYLYNLITEQPATTVYLTNENASGQSPLSLNAYLRNVMGDGTSNQTAYNVSFSWTLPSEFKVDNGSASLTFGNLSNNSQMYNPINISFDNLGSLGPGVVEITISAIGVNSSGDDIVINNQTGVNQTIQLFLECYTVADGVYMANCANDPDAAPVVGTGGSGGGGGASGTSSESIVSSADFQLIRGEENEVEITFANKDLENPITDIEFSVKSVISKYIKINPNKLAYLGAGKSFDLVLEITSPTYVELGKHEVMVTMRGTKGAGSYINSKNVVLEIHELSGESAQWLLDDSDELLKEFSEAGLSFDYLNELFEEAELAMEIFEYETVRDNAREIKSQVRAAIEAKDAIEELEGLIEIAKEKGIGIGASERLLKLAKLSLERKEFLEAYDRVADAQSAYAFEVKGELAKIGYYLKAYPERISLGAFFLMLFSFGSYRVGKLHLIKKRIKALKSEEKLINQLIGVVQKECFKENKMSMDEYETAIEEYQKRLAKITGNLISLENQRIHALRFTGASKKLKRERDNILKLITVVQTDYLKKRTMEPQTYNLKLKSYNKRLGEIDEMIATIEAKKFFKKDKGGEL